jgi:hypothetical protein
MHLIPFISNNCLDLTLAHWKKLSASDSQSVDATVYRQLIGSLMYLVNTRPDICFVVNTLIQYMVEPRSVHMVGAKHILRYIVGTVEYGLLSHSL